MEKGEKISVGSAASPIVCRAWRIRQSIPAVYVPVRTARGKSALSCNPAVQHTKATRMDDSKVIDATGMPVPIPCISKAITPYVTLESRTVPFPSNSQVRIHVCAAAITAIDILKMLDLQDVARPKSSGRKEAKEDSEVSLVSSEEQQNEESVEIQEGVMNHALHREPSSRRRWLSTWFGNSENSFSTKGGQPSTALDILGLSHPTTSPYYQIGGKYRQGYWGGTVGVGWIEAVGKQVEEEGSIAVGDKVLFHAISSPISSHGVHKKKAPQSAEDFSSIDFSESGGGGTWGEYVLVESDMVAPLKRTSKDAENSSPASCVTASQYSIAAESNDVKRLICSAPDSDAFLNIRNEEVAALLFPASTAYIALFDKLCIQPGESILVVGGLTNSVGFIAAQLAHFFGLNVWVSSEESEEEEGVNQFLRKRGIQLFRPSNCIPQSASFLRTEAHESRKTEYENKNSNRESICAPFDHLLICSMSALSEASRQLFTADVPSDKKRKDSSSSSLSSGTKGKKTASLQDCGARAAGQRWSQFIMHHTCRGGNVCVTAVPPPDALLYEFQQLEENDVEGRMRGLRKQHLSLHFVFIYGLLQHPLTRHLLCQVGVKVCKLYSEGAFQLRISVSSSFTKVSSSERVIQKDAQNVFVDENACSTDIVTDLSEMDVPENALKVFSISQLPEALLEKARRRNFFCTGLHEEERETTITEEDLRKEKKRPQTLFFVLNLESLSESDSERFQRILQCGAYSA